MKALLSAMIVVCVGGKLHPPVTLWGFYPHKMINRLAVFTLPPPMISFYKYHIHAITELAVQADRRRYVNPAEASYHYIDLDVYGYDLSDDWRELNLGFPKDSLISHGTLPWNLNKVKKQLTRAFKNKNTTAIIGISADAGHYLADAHVPLHTTSNYNGQQSGQRGIHGFWETRVPELLWEEFDLWLGPARYWTHFNEGIWEIILGSHLCLDSVFSAERKLTDEFPKDRKYSYEVRNQLLVRVYSHEFTMAYHRELDGQVERRLRSSIQAVGDFWYTCWVDAGQPDLNRLLKKPGSREQYLPQEDSIWRDEHKLRGNNRGG